MRALFCAQGQSLGMFDALARELTSRSGVDPVGFYIADQQFHDEYCRTHPDFRPAATVGEWDVVRKARSGTANRAHLEALERQLGGGSLLRALRADRRVSMGALAPVTQHDTWGYDENTSLRLLEEGVAAIEGLFDAINPEVVFGFICVTFGEYLAYLVARARGVPVLNVRPTRIEDYVTLAPDIFEPSGIVAALMADPPDADPAWAAAAADARRFLEATRAGQSTYEGVIPVSRKPPLARKSSESAARRFGRLAAGQLRQWSSPDPHRPPPLAAMYYRRVAAPVRAWQLHRRLTDRYWSEGDMADMRFAFFPLHTEPENTLLVHSPFFANQQEIVRQMARALPAGMILVVKEHPASIGKRPLAYYESLLSEPNVRLADPALRSSTIIARARLIITIAGSIGFEAAVAGVPVLTLGNTPYELLPGTMVKKVGDVRQVDREIRELLDTYRWDEEALIHYLTATVWASNRINLYSVLLAKSGVFVPATEGRTWDTEVRSLADLCLRLMPAARAAAAR